MVKIYKGCVSACIGGNLKTFDILENKTNIFGQKALEASAGTGKTFSIEHLVLRLLLEKNELSIDQILVVTFTKAATKELKFRIRANIEKALQFLKFRKTEEKNIFNYLLSYHNCKKSISKLQDALDLFETAQIFTIHSFCYKTLKEFAIEADVNIDLKADENNFQNFIRDKIYDFFKYYINTNEYSLEQINVIINHHRSIENLCSKIIQSLDKKIIDKKYENFSKQHQKLISKIRLFEKVDLDESLNLFNKISSDYKKARFKEDNFFDQIKHLVTIINSEKCTFEDFEKLLKNKLSICEFLSDNNKKAKSKSAILPIFFHKVKQDIYPIILEVLDPKIIFQRLLNDIKNYLNEILQKEDILTFDGILYTMKEAIKSEFLKKRLQNKYRAVIIDEFQDTDHIQFEIFETLFLSNSNIISFYLIGDPKQSIYSFRKADLYTYIKATKKINDINYLDTNYRSSKSLINSLNALFSEDFSKDWLKLPQINDSLKYLPVKSGGKSDFNFQDDLAPIHFFIAEDVYKFKKWPSETIELKCFTFITNEILKLKNNNNFSDKNFAVLVNDRYQAKRLKDFFYKYSINAITAKSSSLKNSESLQALKDFFKAVLNPLDLNKVKIALKGPFVQFDDQKIKNIDNQKQISFFNEFQHLKIQLEKGLPCFFSSFFSSSWDGKTILENIASKKNINFYHEIISIIEIIFLQENLTVHRILSFFNQLESLDFEDERLKVNQPSNEGVNILTTFMSKGLEFDIVFALGLASRNVEMMKDKLSEVDAEKMRQFYVAITRARFRSYLPIAIDSLEKPIEKGAFSCMDYFFAHILDSDNYLKKKELLEKLDILKEKKHITYSFIDDLKIKNFKKQKPLIFLQKPEKLHFNFTSKEIFSFSSLTKVCDSFSDNSLIEKKQNQDFPIGPKMGVIFHKIFEKIINKKGFRDDAIKKIISENIISTEFELYEKKIFLIIKRALTVPLLKDGFCLKDVSFSKMKTEVEFLFSLKNDYIKGFIDLVFEHQDKFYIVDWKSNYLGDQALDYKTENIEMQMKLNNYFLQSGIYTEGLRRYLKVINEDFEKKFGGVFYIFLRGFLFDERCGIYHFFPNKSKAVYPKDFKDIKN